MATGPVAGVVLAPPTMKTRQNASEKEMKKDAHAPNPVPAGFAPKRPPDVEPNALPVLVAPNALVPVLPPPPKALVPAPPPPNALVPPPPNAPNPAGFAPKADVPAFWVAPKPPVAS